MRFVAKAARKSCLPCLSELISERAGAAGLGFSFGVDRFSMRALAFWGARTFWERGNGPEAV